MIINSFLTSVMPQDSPPERLTGYKANQEIEVPFEEHTVYPINPLLLKSFETQPKASQVFLNSRKVQIIADVRAANGASTNRLLKDRALPDKPSTSASKPTGVLVGLVQRLMHDEPESWYSNGQKRVVKMKVPAWDAHNAKMLPFYDDNPEKGCTTISWANPKASTKMLRITDQPRGAGYLILKDGGVLQAMYLYLDFEVFLVVLDATKRPFPGCLDTMVVLQKLTWSTHVDATVKVNKKNGTWEYGIYTCNIICGSAHDVDPDESEEIVDELKAMEPNIGNAHASIKFMPQAEASPTTVVV